MRVLRTVRAVLCEVVQRGLAVSDDLADTLSRGHSKGSALPRRALGDVVAGCRSAPECDLRDVLAGSSVPDEPVWNQPLPDLRGNELCPMPAWPGLAW